MIDLNTRTGKYYIDSKENKVYYQLMDGSYVSLDLRVFLKYIKDSNKDDIVVSDLFKEIFNDIKNNMPELFL